MANQQPVQPIQIKKIKKSDGHHGGAWKMAYADFVTTMMSLFLALWLANISTKKTTSPRQECKVHRPSLKLYSMYAAYPHSHTGNHADSLYNKTPQHEHARSIAKKTHAKSMLTHIAQSLQKELHGYATLVMTDTGLRIDFLHMDEDMFYKNSSELTARGAEALEKVAEVLRKISNSFAITGFADKDFSSTKLGLNRALVTEEFFQSQGTPQSQITKVSGEACPSAEGENSDLRYNSISIAVLDVARE